MMEWRRIAEFDFAPTHWPLAVVRVAGRSWHRSQNRKAALYVGGVCFYAMLAIFPALALIIGVYSIMFTPEQARHQAVFLTRLMPPGPQAIFQAEFVRLAAAPIRLVSAQSAAALLIAFYAAHRGVKALLAGLSLIHDEVRPRGIVGFNVLALAVALAGFALLAVISALFLALRVVAESLELTPLTHHARLFNEWTWAGSGLVLGLTLTYRYAMASKRVPWRASLVGGSVAAGLTLLASWFGAYYVQQVAHFGATYGSVSGVVIFLVWLSWNVNAIFYGAAVVTEMEILARRPAVQLVAGKAAPKTAKASLLSRRGS
jgi:membrane protein